MTADTLRAAIGAAHGALAGRMKSLAPDLARDLLPWMRARAGAGKPAAAYFTHPLAFPVLALPWWFEDSLGGVDGALQADLLHSSMAGYYLIRLIDDVMDRSPDADTTLLPAVAIFHAEFHGTYAARFPPADPFWPVFFAAWARMHEAAAIDARLDDIDEAAFRRYSGRKTGAGLIPLTAVARHHGLAAPPEPWPTLFAELCDWHRFYNDLMDWRRDSAAGVRTLFLCEAERRRAPSETLVGWVAREGFERGVARLEEGLARLQALASQAGSAGLTAWLARRAELLENFASGARRALPTLAALDRLTFHPATEPHPE